MKIAVGEESNHFCQTDLFSKEPIVPRKPESKRKSRWAIN